MINRQLLYLFETNNLKKKIKYKKTYTISLESNTLTYNHTNNLT